MRKFTFIDLFSGIGGFHQALETAGGVCLGFSEIARDAIAAYCANYNVSEDRNLGDITKLKELPKHDFLTAGVPCQSWSIAGKNLGFDDDRGQLWNDTLFLLKEAQPKVFIFENVKGLADPRNHDALTYILARIRQAGYFARPLLLNAYDYGVPQTRVRIYIVGFKEQKYYNRFSVPKPCPGKVKLGDILDNINSITYGAGGTAGRSLSCNEMGLNDYFLFNDLRNGHTTIHSWDIIPTTERQKSICSLLLRNRRKSVYGVLDGNALGLNHFQQLDSAISFEELEELVELEILKHCPYRYEVCLSPFDSSSDETLLLSHAQSGIIVVDELRSDKELKKHRISIADTLHKLEGKGVVKCIETRYDFKNAKISTGLNGINRIFLPSSKIYPTLVASDTNDFVSDVELEVSTKDEWKRAFMEKVFQPGNFRKISKSEACKIQGFPPDFILPEARSRWMKLIGNSVAVPVVSMLVNSIVKTGVFGETEWNGRTATEQNLFSRVGIDA